MIATAASMSYQSKTYEVSTRPLLVSPPATLMMEIIIVQTLRQRMPPRASLRRMLIRTFQSRRTGIEMTDFFVNTMENHIAYQERRDLRKASERMSRVVMDLSTPFCRE